ncbi:hypothetical protein D9M68_723050 [compost metagenome]
MASTLGEPREALIELLQSELGRMVARQIDAPHQGMPKQQIAAAANRMAKMVAAMSRDDLEACHVELNRFFAAVPFTAAIPVVIAIEHKWPHHVETIPEANRRLDRIRKGGEYALLFSTEKLRNLLVCIQEIEETQ